MPGSGWKRGSRNIAPMTPSTATGTLMKKISRQSTYSTR